MTFGSYIFGMYIFCMGFSAFPKEQGVLVTFICSGERQEEEGTWGRGELVRRDHLVIYLWFI